MLLCAYLPGVLNIPFAVIGVVLVILYFVGMFAIEYFFSDNTEEKLVDGIIKKMTKDGYECKKEEGVLTYRLNDRQYRAYFWKTSKDCFRTEFLDYATIDADWDSISIEGKSVLANYVNNECPHISMIANKGGVVFSHITTVSDAGDFVEKAKLTYRIIGEAMSKATDVMPQIKGQYITGNSQNHIGFNSNK